MNDEMLELYRSGKWDPTGKKAPTPEERDRLEQFKRQLKEEILGKKEIN
ncbi:MAG: hypothetical protein IJ237_05935 [Oscillospiraceae bacterium]|nr:hypothetical protein [Oscillospiraceae bacterium]